MAWLLAAAGLFLVLFGVLAGVAAHGDVVERGKAAEREHVQVPLRYELLLNSKYSAEAKYAMLVHELAHLYCGHLGSPNHNWWPDRRGLADHIREFEAESVCYLVCSRLGLDNPSDAYIASYVREHDETPSISLDCVMKTSGLIEQMGRERLKPRKDRE